MSSRKLTDLVPAVHRRANDMLLRCERDGITLIVTCTYRSPVEQSVLYVQGRWTLDAVNVARSKIKLPPITQKDNRIVTNAQSGESMHQYRIAVDVVPTESGRPIWAATHPVWREVGKHGKAAGLEWAGEWKRFREFPHFQFTGGLTLEQLKRGAIPEDLV